MQFYKGARGEAVAKLDKIVSSNMHLGADYYSVTERSGVTLVIPLELVVHIMVGLQAELKARNKSEEPITVDQLIQAIEG